MIMVVMLMTIMMATVMNDDDGGKVMTMAIYFTDKCAKRERVETVMCGNS